MKRFFGRTSRRRRSGVSIGLQRTEVAEVRLLLSAQVQIVRDIDPSTSTLPFFGHSVVSSGRFVLAGETPTAGGEFWFTGTPGGDLRLLPQTQPGFFGTNASFLTDVQGTVFYVGEMFPDVPYQLYKLNPLTGQTEQLTSFSPGQSLVSHYSNLTAVGSQLYFSKRNSASESELWRSDGTVAGTQRVAVVSTSSDLRGPYSFTAVGGLLYFATQLNGVDELWRSDGSEAGTFRVPVGGSTGFLRNPKSLSEHQGQLYFEAWNETFGQGLWKTDGTAAGTTLVSNFGLPLTPGPETQPGPESNILSDGVRLYISAPLANAGAELWVSDGSTAGTVLVKDIRPGAASSRIGNLTRLGNVVLFGADDGIHGRELWATDGTATGTYLVSDLRPGPGSSNVRLLRGTGSRIYMQATDDIHGTELWVTDGSAAGTRMIADLNPGSGSSTSATYTVFGEQMYFSLYFHPSGNQVWVTDGTEAGTRVARPWPPGSASSNPRSIVKHGDVGLFVTAAQNGSSGLWRTDGTRAGTSLLYEFNPTGTWPGHRANQLLNAGAVTLGIASDPEAGSELWVTDGTTDGTRRLFDVRPGPQGSNAILRLHHNGLTYFSADDGTSGLELWVTDGTETGTRLLKDIRSGVSGSNPRTLFVLGESVYFVADDGIHGAELWSTNGTEAGTVMVHDVLPGAGNGVLEILGVAGGRLLFQGYSSSSALDLWATDGTPGGTQFVHEVTPESASTTTENGRLYFTARGTSGSVVLWITDGTPANTQVVRDFPHLSGNANYLGSLTVLGNRLLFTARTPELGRELWVSDGTESGTQLVRDIRPGSASSNPDGLQKIGNRVYFSAVDPLLGDELWVTDGTLAGTELVAEVESGVSGSRPVAYELNSDVLLIVATTSRFGTELYALNASTPDLTAPPSRVSVMRPRIEWTPVPNATGYEVQIRNSSTGKISGIIPTNSNPWFDPSEDLGIGRFTVWVRSVLSSGRRSEWSVPRNFVVETPVSLDPVASRQMTSRPVISWTGMPGAVRYDVWIDDVSRGLSQVVRNTNVTATQFQPAFDLPIGTYRVWVRGIDAGNEPRRWSQAIQFQVVPSPVPVSPLNATFSRQPTFNWSAVAGAEEYEVLLIDRNSSRVVWNQRTTQTSLVVPQPLEFGPYRWQVRAFGPAGVVTDFSPVHLIWIGGRPTAIQPAGNVSGLPVFRWTPVEGAARYRLQVDRIDVPQSRVVFEQQLTSSSFTNPSSLPSGTYRWWVQAISGTGTSSAWSAPLDFIVTG